MPPALASLPLVPPGKPFHRLLLKNYIWSCQAYKSMSQLSSSRRSYTKTDATHVTPCMFSCNVALPLCLQEMGSDSSRLESGENLVLGHLLATNSIRREEVLRGFWSQECPQFAERGSASIAAMCTCVQRYHQLHTPRGKTPSLVPVCVTVAVQSLSQVQLFVTPWAAAHRASLSLTISWSSPKFMSIGSVIPPNHMLCHPLLLLPSILSQPQGLFRWIGCLHSFQHQSFQWVFRVDFLQHGLVGSPCSPRDSQESSPTPQSVSISYLVFNLPYGPTLTMIHDYWKNHSFD